MPMKRTLGALLIAAGTLSSQDTRGPTFEVASVKPAPRAGVVRGGITGGPGSADPTRWSSINATLESLVQQAYGLRRYQFVGPAWTDELRFDVEAKLAPKTSKDQFRLMLQNLLEERFQLSFHFQRREIPALELVLAKGGPKLKAPGREQNASTPAPDKHGASQLRLDKMGYPVLFPGMTVAMSYGKARCHFLRISMTEFVGSLAAQVDRPVFDATGLTGEYEVDLYSVNEERQPTTDESHSGAIGGGPTIFTALRDQLGLKLENRKREVDVLVVDRALQAPTRN
jgi:uncharacterized protein (TIGR03435 family)